MRGQLFHNRILVGGVIAPLRLIGAEITTEAHVAPGRRSGYVDVLVELFGLRVVVEAENTNRRVWRDVEKAVALKADLLLIVTPTKRISLACESVLRSHPLPLRPIVKCLPLGPAKALISDRCQLMRLLNVTTSQTP